LAVGNPAQKGKPYSTRITLAGDVDLALPGAVPQNLPKLVPYRGQFLRGINGAPFTAIGATDFRLYSHYLDGLDIEPVLQQRQQLGFNWVRIFGMCDFMWKFHPQRFGERYYTELVPFYELLSAFGIYGELTCFVDTRLVMPDPNHQIHHWNRVSEVFQGIGNHALEGVNEGLLYDNPVEALDSLQQYPGVLCARGSSAGGGIPMRPPMVYETFHWNDAHEWPRKVGHNPLEDGSWVTGRPGVSNENTRFPDRCSSPEMAYDAAACGALLCAGSVFHSNSGKVSARWAEGSIEHTCAKAWADGAKSVPLAAQDGAYHRTVDERFMRVYHRIAGDNVYTVHVRWPK
jgi:hypothetical protein